MDINQFKKSRRESKENVKTQWGRFPDNDLLEAEGDYAILEDVHKRCGDQKEEAERWAEDWCERGGWRKNNRSADRD